ncbi:MAG: C45 family autoproteolytic acyltransferase/hydrolase [Promethearchaeota archaeon]
MMFEQKLSGSYYNMGLETGRMFKKLGLPKFPPKLDEAQLEFGRKCTEVVEAHAPGLLEELQGMADGSGFDFDVFAASELCLSIKSACSVIAISGEHMVDGVPVLLRNHDWNEGGDKDLTVCWTSPEGGLKSLGTTFLRLRLARFGGVNEAGLAISSALADWTNPQPGVMFHIATRWILDTCQSTKEAVAYLEKIPKTWGMMYVIADKANDIAIVEAHAERMNVIWPDNGFAAVSNNFHSPEMKVLDKRGISWENPRIRVEYYNDWFVGKSGSISLEEVQAVMRNHEHFACDHVEGGFTIWSWIAPIGERKLLVCQGSPCKGEYVPYTF